MFLKMTRLRKDEAALLELPEIPVKRLYLPAVLVADCPYCRYQQEVDLYQDYVSYPSTEEVEFIPCCCNHCGEEFEMIVRLRLFIDFIGVKANEN